MLRKTTRNSSKCSRSQNATQTPSTPIIYMNSIRDNRRRKILGWSGFTRTMAAKGVHSAFRYVANHRMFYKIREVSYLAENDQ